MQERRSYERFDVEGSINIKSVNGKPRLLSGRLVNIGFGGFTIYTEEKIEGGKTIEFELILVALDQPLAGKGKITYTNALVKEKTTLFSMGVEFIDINKGIITHFMKRLQLKIAREVRDKKKIKPLDFLPY